MKNIVKIMGILVGLVVVVIIAAAIALPVFVDPNDFKQEITDAVKDATGRDLIIQDDIGLSVFPWLGVELGAVQLSNAKDFGDKPFVKVNKADVKIKLLPLLRKEVEMETIKLQGLELQLMKNKNGRTNWADLTKPGKEQKAEDESADAGVLAALAIGGLDIRDAHIVWDDRSTNTRQTIDNLNINTGELSFGMPVDVDISFDIESTQPAMKGSFTLLGEMAVDLASQIHTFNDMQLIANVSGKDIPNHALALKLFGNLSTDLASQLVQLKNLKLKLDDTTVTGSLGMKRFDKPAYNFNLVVDTIDADRYTAGTNKAATASPVHTAAAGTTQLPVETLRKLNANGKLVIKEMKASGIRSQDINIELKANNGWIALHPVSAKMYGGTYNGNIRIDARKSVPMIAMDEKLSGVQVGKLLKDFSGKDTLTGTTNFNLKLVAQGKTTDAIRKNLNGNASFSFKDGALKGVNNLKEILNTLALLRGIPPGNSDTSNETPFSSLTGSMKFTNGVGTNNDLLLDSPLLKITGAGKIDLVKEWVNYRAKAVLSKDIQVEGFKSSELDKIRGKSIPVAINCSLKAINADCFKYSLEDLIKEEIESKIKEKLFERFIKPKPPTQTTEPAQQTEPAQEQQPVDLKEQLKNDLKKKLLEGLFR